MGEITHGLRIKYGGSTYGISGCSSREEAADAMADILVDRGYTFPKPWQFWRWDEHKPSKYLREALEKKGVM